MSRRPAVALGALVLLASACGGPEVPSPRVAGQRLAGWMELLSRGLTDGVRPTQPWTPTADGTDETTDGCGRKTVRRAYAATVEVPASSTDAGARGDLVVGALDQLGWDATAPRVREDGGVLSAMRAGRDATRTKMALEYTAVPGGWRYEVTAKTACLPVR